MQSLWLLFLSLTLERLCLAHILREPGRLMGSPFYFIKNSEGSLSKI
jgi:hypothetical protein